MADWKQVFCKELFMGQIGFSYSESIKLNFILPNDLVEVFLLYNIKNNPVCSFPLIVSLFLYSPYQIRLSILPTLSSSEITFLLFLCLNQ